jgi:hypothetical protein
LTACPPATVEVAGEVAGIAGMAQAASRSVVNKMQQAAPGNLNLALNHGIVALLPVGWDRLRLARGNDPIENSSQLMNRTSLPQNCQSQHLQSSLK